MSMLGLSKIMRPMRICAIAILAFLQLFLLPLTPLHAIELEKALGIWEGTFVCNTTEYHARLIVKSQDGPSLLAVMEYSLNKNSLTPEGRFELQGFFMDFDGSVRLNPLRWLKRPQGHGMFGMYALIDSEGKLVGEVTESSCKTIQLARVGAENEAMVAQAKIDADRNARFGRLFSGAATINYDVELFILRIKDYDKGTLRMQAELEFLSSGETRPAQGGARLNTSGEMPFEDFILHETGGNNVLGGCRNVQYQFVVAGVKRDRYAGSWKCLESELTGLLAAEIQEPDELARNRSSAADWRDHVRAASASADAARAAAVAEAEQKLAADRERLEIAERIRLERRHADQAERAQRRAENVRLTAEAQERLDRVKWLANRQTSPEAQENSLMLTRADMVFVDQCNEARASALSSRGDCLNDLFPSGDPEILRVSHRLTGETNLGSSGYFTSMLCSGCTLRLDLACRTPIRAPAGLKGMRIQYGGDGFEFLNSEISNFGGVPVTAPQGSGPAGLMKFADEDVDCVSQVYYQQPIFYARYTLTRRGFATNAVDANAAHTGYRNPEDFVVFGISPEMSPDQVFRNFRNQSPEQVEWVQKIVAKLENGRCDTVNVFRQYAEGKETGRRSYGIVDELMVRDNRIRSRTGSNRSHISTSPFQVAKTCDVSFVGDTIQSISCQLAPSDSATGGAVAHFTSILGPPAKAFMSEQDNGAQWYCGEYPNHRDCIFSVGNFDRRADVQFSRNLDSEATRINEEWRALRASQVCKQ